MGAYRIARQVIPTGGYLETYVGRQVGTDKPVLLKHFVHPPSLEKLMESLRLIRGPALANVLEVGTGADGLWLVVEAAEGESLRWVMSTLARAAGFIAPNEGLAVVARVARALDALHKQGLAHGDVCPATIFLSARGEVQLHDGGIAAVSSAQAELGPCRSELNALAPEQVSGPASIESDVFRLGLVLYELSVGRPLWNSPSAPHLCHAASTWAGLTREKVKQVPEPWLTLLVTMLAVEPRSRPSMEEVIVVLDQAVRQNQWATTAQEIATLFARAGQGRVSPFELPGMQELHLVPLTPPGGVPAVTGPAVVARVTTRKMTREMLAVARADTAAPEATNASLQVRAANLLVEQGKLSRAQLCAALEAVGKGGDVSSLLIDESGVDEDALVAAAAELTRTPSISMKKLAEAVPSKEALALVPIALSQATQSVPLGLKSGSQLMVAMADPMDPQALEQLKAAISPRSLIAFRAGTRALSVARARLYGKPTSSQPASAAVGGSNLAPRIIDALLGLQGLRGTHAQQLVALSSGLSRRLGASPAEATQVALVARAMVTGALAAGRLPHEVPRLAEVHERLGITEADEFIEALHAFPAQMPERPMVKAVVVAFAFAAHAGEPRPSGSRLGGALSSFRSRHQLPQVLVEALMVELS
ncbi:MAG: protein kinase [Archangium sp.]|nr:protein kinase [Archangium sp.]